MVTAAGQSSSQKAPVGVVLSPIHEYLAHWLLPMPLFTSAVVKPGRLPPGEALAVAVRARLTLQLQSLSLALVQPSGQQPSPPVHAVTAVPPHLPMVHLALETQAPLPGQGTPSLA